MKFTPEELAEMAAADAEIEANFIMTQSEIDFSRELDKTTRFEKLTGDKQKVAAQRKAYYEANREKVAAQRKAYYEANREKVAAQQKAYREANREAYNAYMREYMRKRKDKRMFETKAG